MDWDVPTAPLHKICVWTRVRKIKRKSLMHDSDWLKLNLRWFFWFVFKRKFYATAPTSRNLYCACVTWTYVHYEDDARSVDFTSSSDSERTRPCHDACAVRAQRDWLTSARLGPRAVHTLWMFRLSLTPLQLPALIASKWGSKRFGVLGRYAGVEVCTVWCPRCRPTKNCFSFITR